MNSKNKLTDHYVVISDGVVDATKARNHPVGVIHNNSGACFVGTDPLETNVDMDSLLPNYLFLFFPYLNEENTYIIAYFETGEILGVSNKLDSGNRLMIIDDWGSSRHYEKFFKLEQGKLIPLNLHDKRVSYSFQTIMGETLGVYNIDNKNSGSSYGTDFQFLFPKNSEIIKPSISESGDEVDILPPPLTEHQPPISQEVHAVRIVHIPYFLVHDEKLNTEQKIKQSPYYILERRVRLITKGEWYTFNDSPIEQEFSQTTTVGWSKTDANSFTATAGLSFESGSNFIAKFTVTVSLELSYTHESSFTETYEESKTFTIKAPPKHSIVMWQGSSEFILRRSDGSEVKRWSRNDGSRYYRSLAYDGSSSILHQWNESQNNWEKITEKEEILA